MWKLSLKPCHTINQVFMLSTWCRRVRAPAGDAAGPHQPRDRPRVRAQPLRQVDPQHLGVQEGSARTGDKLQVYIGNKTS